MTMLAAVNFGAEGLDLGETYLLNPSTGTTVKGVYGLEPSILVNNLVRNIFVIAGVIFFVTVIYAGFKFIQEGAKGKDEARQILTTATIGFILMFTAYWIVKIIALITGADIVI